MRRPLTQRLKLAQDLNWWDMRHMPGILRDPAVRNMQRDLQGLSTPMPEAAGFPPWMQPHIDRMVTGAGQRTSDGFNIDELRPLVEQGRSIQPFVDSARTQMPDNEFLGEASKRIGTADRALRTHDYMALFNQDADPNAAKLRPGMFVSQDRANQFNQLPAAARHFMANQAHDPVHRAGLNRHMEIMERQRAETAGEPVARVRARYRAPTGGETRPLTNRMGAANESHPYFRGNADAPPPVPPPPRGPDPLNVGGN